MSEITIKTNHVPRPLLDWQDLTDKERAELDYLVTEDEQASASFFRYKGSVYDLAEFMTSPPSMWDGYYPESFFSGIVVKYVDHDPDYVIVGRYFA